jgi:hypothetical protein
MTFENCAGSTGVVARGQVPREGPSFHVTGEGELIDKQQVTGRDGHSAGANRNSFGEGGGGGAEGEREKRKAKAVTKTTSLSELGLLDSSSSGGRTGLFGDDGGGEGEGEGLGWLAHTKPKP